MKWHDLNEDACSIARTLSVIGDRWTILIIKECFWGVSSFGEFHCRLGISKALLSQRLKELVAVGVLVREDTGDPFARNAYKLTRMGKDLFPVIMAMAQWGNAYLNPQAKDLVRYRHKPCGELLKVETTCKACGEELRARDVAVEPGEDLSDEQREKVEAAIASVRGVKPAV